MSELQKIKENYQERLGARKQTGAGHDKSIDSIAFLRLIVFLAGAGLGIVASVFSGVSYFWLAVPIGLFLVLVVRHDQVIRKKEIVDWSIRHYEMALARIDEKWVGSGIIKEDYVDEEHIYAKDLDIFGPGSLFELMCTARSKSGEEKLASWLSGPASRDEILKRQEAVKELADRVDLREEIYLTTKAMGSIVQPEKLRNWAQLPPKLPPSKHLGYRILFFAMAALAIGSVVLCFFSDFGLAVLVGVAFVEWLIGRVLRNPVEDISSGVQGRRSELKLLSGLLSRIEDEPGESSMLQSVKERLTGGGSSASADISRLGKLADWLDQSRNQIFAPIGFLLMWNQQFALSIEKWRLRRGERIPSWLDALGDFEALCALSCYTYERPMDVFPTIVESGPYLKGEEMGHPLLPKEDCVRNSVELTNDCKIWVVSGSNMSGKSTFLRVVGVNTVLAMAGAPVCAKQMHVSELSTGSTIRIFDSLKKGKSRFFAEISILKQIMTMAGHQPPLLFLLDEILHGTNSHDRKIGAEAIVQQLVRIGAVGLVTTHDLALAAAADEMGPTAKNVHFADQVEASGLHFDYILKDGVVSKSNALELMRSVGIEV